MSRHSVSPWRVLDHLRRRPQTPIALCIDVEPDPLVFDPADPPPWLGFEGLVERLPALRERLSEATQAPAAFTWCLRMDPQVEATWGSAAWVVEKYGDLIADLDGEGDEFGLHTHTWRWESDPGEWIADFEDPSWAEHCVAMALDAYETSFGRGCAVHRGGAHFLSGAMLSSLEARRVAVDLTVEPGLASLTGQGEPTRGLTPDYRGVPTRPYRSNPSVFPAPDPGARTGPVLVPLMSAPRRRPPFRRVPLCPEEPSRIFRSRLAAELLRKPSILGFAIRSSYVLGPEWEVIEENLEHLAEHHQMKFQTARAAVESHGGTWG